MKCGHLPSRQKKESSLVSVVNKLQYHDTHPEDSTGNKPDTDYIFSVFRAVSKKQHTIYTYIYIYIYI